MQGPAPVPPTSKEKQMPYYYPVDFKTVDAGAAMELRAHIALDLLRTNGLLASVPDGDDTRGRRAYNLMPPKELVYRAVKIAEEFVSACEERGYLRVPSITPEEAAAEVGRLQHIQNNAVWRKPSHDKDPQ
jgi:hypothetical protein